MGSRSSIAKLKKTFRDNSFKSNTWKSPSNRMAKIATTVNPNSKVPKYFRLRTTMVVGCTIENFPKLYLLFSWFGERSIPILIRPENKCDHSLHRYWVGRQFHIFTSQLKKICHLIRSLNVVLQAYLPGHISESLSVAENAVSAMSWQAVLNFKDLRQVYLSPVQLEEAEVAKPLIIWFTTLHISWQAEFILSMVSHSRTC